MNIVSNPLESRDDIEKLRTTYFKKKGSIQSTSCWRGYIAEWTIVGNELFLSNVYSCDIERSWQKFDLDMLFREECVNGMVRATWVNSHMVIPKGKLIQYIQSEYESFYEQEMVLKFSSGTLEGYDLFDNSKSFRSVLAENQDSLDFFIYSNINWDVIPDLGNQRITVYIAVLSSDSPRPDSIYIAKKSNAEVFNSEALRVGKLIPEWNVYYRLGDVFRMKWTFPVHFSEENRAKYRRLPAK